MNDVHVATVRFELRVQFVVKALVATVRQGRLDALGFGACDVTATLAAEGLRLAEQRARLDLSLLIPLPLHRRDGEAPPYGAEPSAGAVPAPAAHTDQPFDRSAPPPPTGRMEPTGAVGTATHRCHPAPGAGEASPTCRSAARSRERGQAPAFATEAARLLG